MMQSKELGTTLQEHWKSYVAKHHRYSYVRNVADEAEHDDNVETSDDDDEDCIVHLAGNDDEIDDDWANLVEQGHEKRMRLVPV